MNKCYHFLYPILDFLYYTQSYITTNLLDDILIWIHRQNCLESLPINKVQETNVIP